MKRLLIYGFSKPRAELASKIDDQTRPLMETLICLYIFPDNENRNHWRGEVWSLLNKMDLLKGKNKLPSKQFILDNSWELNKKYLDDRIKYVIDKEDSYEPAEFGKVSLRCTLEEYFDWLADKLSRQTYVSKQEVYSLLDELGL